MANNYKNAKVDLTTTNITTLYTVPGSTTTIVKSILVSEDSGNADTITLTLMSIFVIYMIWVGMLSKEAQEDIEKNINRKGEQN